jgi:hypothetical protein
VGVVRGGRFPRLVRKLTVTTVMIPVSERGGTTSGMQRSNRDDQSSVRSLGGFDITSMKSVRIVSSPAPPLSPFGCRLRARTAGLSGWVRHANSLTSDS